MTRKGQAEGLRIGVLCNGPQLAKWQAECLRHIERLPFAKIVAVVVNAAPPAAPAPLLKRIRRGISSGLLIWRLYERLVLNRKVRATQTVPFPPELQKAHQVHCTPVKVGKFREKFDTACLEALQAHEPDVLIRFGFGILTGEVLSAARYGIWSFHHGDPQHFRGAPPGFWEIHNGAPVTGVVLQRLTESLDGGVILHSGWFKTDAASYPRSLDRILFNAAHFVARALLDLRHNPHAFLGCPALANPGPVYRYPRTMAMLRFLLASAGARIKDQLRSLFRHQQWTLGIVRENLATLCESTASGQREIRAVDWVPETKGTFLADPFVMSDPSNSGEFRVFTEKFDWKSDRGDIALVESVDSGIARTTPSIINGLHLSYPYIIEEHGERYCVPECAQSNAVTIYRWDAPKGRWAEHGRLLENFPALDPTIFKYDRRWWLFCTSAAEGANEQLFAWHAKDLTGPWEPHMANPMKVDIRSARPAGRPFIHNGQLIRPAQDCSTHYGAAIVFNRVLTLTPDQFTEEPIGKLLPCAEGPYPAGLHTVGTFGEFTIIDGARWTFVPAEMRRAIARKLGLRQ